MRRRSIVAFLVAAVAVTLQGCSSDAAPEPEADIRTPGAFVAVRGEDAFSLSRTLDTLVVPDSKLILFTEYAVSPQTWDEAREVSKRIDLPIKTEVAFVDESGLVQQEHRVVWFRTLTEEEEERIP
jgi:hypothetical protein